MESDSAIGDGIFITLFEVPIHIGVNQAEDDGFITDEGLVMTFGVRDGFFISAPIRQLPED